MPSPHLDQRRFSEDEVRSILARAVESSSHREGDESNGMSLSELQSIAGEVGIAPERIEAAARAVVASGGRDLHPVWGLPMNLHTERRVVGELNPSSVPEVLATIRRVMGAQGSAQEVLGTLEWRTAGDAGTRLVTVSSRDGSTTVGGTADLKQLAMVAYLPAGIIALFTTVVGFGAAAQAGSAPGMGLALALIPAVYTGIRAVVRRVAAGEAKKLEAVVEAVAQTIEKR